MKIYRVILGHALNINAHNGSYYKTNSQNNLSKEKNKMKPKEVSDLTEEELRELPDQNLLDAAKKIKSTSITNAFFIGFLIAIVFYSIVKNSYGMVTLIPLYFAYKLFNNNKHNKANKTLQNLLKERNLE